MAFIQPCFIRKNTYELRKKIEELGYEPCYPMVQHPEVFKNIATCNFFGSMYYGVSDDEASRPGDISDAIKNGGIIDCGDNEELFFALAALRDDTPINSFYWFNRRLVKCEDKTEKHTFLNGFISILKCGCVDDPNICFGAEEDFLRKATVEEIIEYFKK